jgi:predicted RNA-binding protein with PUA-like domain
VVITDPTMDYIIITDAPDGNELEIVNIDIGGQVIAYASGYNNTGSTYIGLVRVNWTDIPDLGTFDNDTGTNTVFTAGLVGGSTNITGQNTTLVVSDNFTVVIADPTIDYIKITDAPNGNELELVNIDIGGQVPAYASGYNTTSGYVDLADVDWTDVPDLGTFDNDIGTNTVFTAGFIGGATNITGQNTTLLVSDNFTVVIADPTLDYIIITDSPDGNELVIVNIDIGGKVTAYASGYNKTGPTYVGLVEVDWTDVPDLGTFDNDTGVNTVFTSGFIGGSTNITGQNTTLGISDNFTVNIADPTIDYIIITDSPDGNELVIVNINIGGQVTVYASGYNNTGPTYVGLVEVDWTDIPDLGTFDNDTGTNMIFTAGFTGGSTNITGQNTTLVVSDNFTVNIVDPTIDYIIITDSPDGNELVIVNIDIGGQVTSYASGYNNTGPTYVGLVEVDWADLPDLGTFDNDTGTNTVFTAGFIGGSTNITGQNTTLGLSDNFTVNIADPTIDYIIITDAPDGNELVIVNIDIGGQVTAYASGYNNTGSTYVGLVEVDWTDIPDLGTFDNDTGTNTEFTAGFSGGSTNITGQNTTLVVSDNFTVIIADPTIDYIIITDSPDGNELEIVNIDIGGQVIAYASGYNNTGPTYVGLVEVDWTDVPDLGTFDNETGTNTIFTTGYTGGSTNITGQNASQGFSDNFTVIIADPTIDYIIITDSPDGNELEIMNIDIGGQVTAYASGYNNTGPIYVGLIEVNWTDIPDLGTFDNDTGTNTVFTAGLVGGSTTITGQNTTLVVSDNFTVIIADPTIDYILITDTPDGNELIIENIDIGGQVTAYASGYNTTSGYVDLVEVAWTDIPDLGTFNNETGTSTIFTAGYTGGSTNITGQNTTLVVSDNFTVVIADPTLDYIIITDAPDGNELEIVNIDIGGQVTAYASGYNITGPTYVGLVEVNWTDIPDLGTFDNETGTNTIFTAGFTGGFTNITGQNTTLIVSDNFTVVIADPTIDYIIITDSPDGNELEVVNIDIGGQVTAYASGYNNTGLTYVGLVEVDWTDIPDLGTFDNDTGTNKPIQYLPQALVVDLSI